MHLSEHSLNQLDEPYIQSLDKEQLCGLSVRLLEDLKEARERLRQNPSNSSRPPSSHPPWERPTPKDTRKSEDTAAEPEGGASDQSGGEDSSQCPAPEGDPPQGAAPVSQEHSTNKHDAPKRTPGQQPGAPGFGRTQVFKAHDTVEHHASHCEGCGAAHPAGPKSVAYGGYQCIDLLWGDCDQPGLHLHITDHRLYDDPCACGHTTRVRPGESVVEDSGLGTVVLSEWRVVDVRYLTASCPAFLAG